MEAENRHIDPETRQRIIALADELFLEYGIKGISMDEIARRLSMSKRTLYEYFADKEDLLLACIDHHSASMKALSEEISRRAETVLHVLLEIYRDMAPKNRRCSAKFFEDMRKYPKAMAKMAEDRKEHLIQTMTFFETGIKQGIFLPGINYSILSHTMIRMFDEPLPSELSQQYSMPEIHSTLALTLIRGACTEKGLHIFDDYTDLYKAWRDNPSPC